MRNQDNSNHRQTDCLRQLPVADVPARPSMVMAVYSKSRPYGIRELHDSPRASGQGEGFLTPATDAWAAANPARRFPQSFPAFPARSAKIRQVDVGRFDIGKRWQIDRRVDRRHQRIFVGALGEVFLRRIAEQVVDQSQGVVWLVGRLQNRRAGHIDQGAKVAAGEEVQGRP